MSQREPMRALLERSSLGTPGARRLRARTDPQAVRRVLERVRERTAAASRHLDRTPARIGADQHSCLLPGSGERSSPESAPAGLACDLEASATRTPAAVPVAASLRELLLACSIGEQELAAAREARAGLVAAAGRVMLGAPLGYGKSTALALFHAALQQASVERGLGIEDLVVDALDAQAARGLGVVRAHRIRAYVEAALGTADAAMLQHAPLLQGGGHLPGEAELPGLLAAELRGSYWHRTLVQQLEHVDLVVVPVAPGDRPAGLHAAREVLRRWRAGSLHLSSPLPWGSAEALRSHDAGAAMATAQRLIAAALQQAHGTVMTARRSILVAFTHQELEVDLLVPTVVGLGEPLDERHAAMVASALHRRLRGGAAPADVLLAALSAAAGSYAEALVEHHAALWLSRGVSTAAQASRWALWRRCSSTLWRWRDAIDQSLAATGAGEQASRARVTESSAGQADGHVVLFTAAADRLAKVGDVEVDLAAALERLRAGGLQPQVLGVHRLAIPARDSKVS